jgi:hypothetical protein
MVSSEAWKGIAVGTILAVIAGIFATRDRSDTIEWSRERLREGLERPPLWIYVNEGDVNARWWSDFGARSNRALNIPLLNLCYESIVNTQGKRYRVEVIRGLQDLAIRMGGWEELPAPLRSKTANVGKAEMNWIRVAVLERWGGLWMALHGVGLEEIPLPSKENVIGFGTDLELSFSSEKNGTPAPGTHVLWSPRPHHPMMVEWEALCRERVEKQEGGRQVRNDVSEDWWILAEKYGATINQSVVLDRKEVSHKRIELEDLLAAGTGGAGGLWGAGCYVPIVWDELLDRRAFGWILRMSEEQILASDLVISHLLKG